LTSNAQLTAEETNRKLSIQHSEMVLAGDESGDFELDIN